MSFSNWAILWLTKDASLLQHDTKLLISFDYLLKTYFVQVWSGSTEKND